MDRNRSHSSSSEHSVQSKKWDGKSGHRLHVSDLSIGISRKEIERIFIKYGPINEVWVAMNPPCFAFVNFTHRNDAEKALRETDGKTIGSARVKVSWARERTFGGRTRRIRRRSRSRSTSNPRRNKYRSRSSDRHYRRNESSYDRKYLHRTSDDRQRKSRRSSSSNSSKK